jgi:hypothetical protein
MEGCVMSGTTTVSGGIVPKNWSDASGASFVFSKYFTPTTVSSVVSVSGATSVAGTVVIPNSGLTITISGASAIDDAAPNGGNSITSTSPSVVFASQNDTISAASGSTTLFGASSQQTTFSVGGTGNSIVGGSGSIWGVASGDNSTLVGGSAVSLFTVTGSNNLVVAGSGGPTGVDLSGTTGPEQVTTNPLGNSGTLVATLGSGADTVIAGGGASTITAGSGNDVFGFVDGHAGGSVVIIGFNASDNIAFGGYGYSATNVPTETVTSGGDVMTLSDGTTILFAGLDHKLF